MITWCSQGCTGLHRGCSDIFMCSFSIIYLSTAGRWQLTPLRLAETKVTKPSLSLGVSSRRLSRLTPLSVRRLAWPRYPVSVPQLPDSSCRRDVTAIYWAAALTLLRRDCVKMRLERAELSRPGPTDAAISSPYLDTSTALSDTK